MRIGIGFDAHRLAEERELILGGTRIPFDRGLLGHSDADVLTHAVCDALLGAAALGDLGKRFPDSDPQYRGISSLKLASQVVQMLLEHDHQIGNIDATIIAEKPKLSGYIPEMIGNLAGALQINRSQISVKATTTEGMGFTGGQGIAAWATALLIPRSEYDLDLE